MVWDLGTLGPNESKQVSAKVVSGVAGTYEFAGTAQGVCVTPASAKCQTRLVGVPAILLEKADDPDPLGIGETTTYTIKITNQGTADNNNVRLVVTPAA